jgi:hypothetical protein
MGSKGRYDKLGVACVSLILVILIANCCLAVVKTLIKLWGKYVIWRAKTITQAKNKVIVIPTSTAEVTELKKDAKVKE